MAQKLSAYAEPDTHQALEVDNRERKISMESGFGSQSGSPRDSLVVNEDFIDGTVLESLGERLSCALQPSRSKISLDSVLANSTTSSLYPSRQSSRASLLRTNGITDDGNTHGQRLPDDNRSSVHELPRPEVVVSDYDKEQQPPAVSEEPPRCTHSDIPKDKGTADGVQGSSRRRMKRNLGLPDLTSNTMRNSRQMQLGIPSPVSSESDNESTSTEEYFTACELSPTSEPIHPSLESSSEQEESSGSIHREKDLSPDCGRQSTALQDVESLVDQISMTKVAESVDEPTSLRLGVLLHVDPFKIEQIQSECRIIWERTMRILSLWKENAHGNQTLKLAQVMRHVGLGKIAVQIDAKVEENPGPDTFLNPDSTSETISQEEFDEISREVREKWKELAIHLRMPRVQEVIRDVEEKSRVSSVQAFWLLWRWWNHDNKATREHLADALREIRETKLASCIAGPSPIANT